MSEWRECKLGESITSNRLSIGKDYSYNNIIYLDTGSITRGKIDSLQELKLSEDSCPTVNLAEIFKKINKNIKQNTIINGNFFNLKNLMKIAPIL